MKLTRSPLAPSSFPDLPPIKGVQFGVATTEQRYKGRDDLLLITVSEKSTGAGVFTRSACPSAAVDWCRVSLESGDQPRAILVNAGNANAFTGQQGIETCQLMADLVAARLGVASSSVLLASTGVIGVPLDGSHFHPFLADSEKGCRPTDFYGAAQAIMTTDTYPKGAGCVIETGSQPMAISAIAKGSGMIAPDMATMLAFCFTDAQISQPLLTKALQRATAKSFNCITVDSDTSTSDTALLLATGQNGDPVIDQEQDPRFALFEQALTDVFSDLARQIVRDGEGAQKFITIQVTGALNQDDARTLALSVANSPLVKTAIAGEDANWGRVVMAVGKAGVKADRDRLSIRFGSYCLAEGGARASTYDEEAVSAYMKHQDIEIGIDLGLGVAEATIWTCDLTHAYIDINGSYRS